MEFLSCVPTVWDETVVLDAKVADFVFLARRNSKDWYVGGMTDGTSRTYKLDLSFLDPGKYNLTLFRDGINADRFAEDYKKITAEVTPEDAVEIVLAPGGGFAGFLIRE
ncbi:MAG: glycoside hydrolase family 97 C-terminal domain-containing protein [Planctomycetota bacterium]